MLYRFAQSDVRRVGRCSLWRHFEVDGRTESGKEKERAEELLNGLSEDLIDIENYFFNDH